jgi:putative IMPACT (imprinted ancient) family translation regulator
LASRLDNFIELNDYILTIKYNSLDLIYKVIYDNKGVIIDRNFDQNVTLKIRVSTSTMALIEKKFPTTKIQSLA